MISVKQIRFTFVKIFIERKKAAFSLVLVSA